MRHFDRIDIDVSQLEKQRCEVIKLMMVKLQLAASVSEPLY